MTQLVRILTVTVAASLCAAVANGQQELDSLLNGRSHAQSFTGKAFTAATPTCATVTIEKPDSQNITNFNLTNNCGKDLASFSFDLRSLAPGETETHHGWIQTFGLYPHTDWIRVDKNSAPLPDTPMAGSTLHLPLSQSLPEPVVMTITGVLFTDRSAIGTADNVRQLLAIMNDQYASYKEKLEFLGAMLKYEDAVKILRGGADPTGRSQGELMNLRNHLKWNDSSDAWQQFITKEFQTTARLLSACSQATTLRDAQ